MENYIIQKLDESMGTIHNLGLFVAVEELGWNRP